MANEFVDTVARFMYERQRSVVEWQRIPLLHREMWRAHARTELQYAVAMAVIMQVFPEAKVIEGRGT